jgi:hypothetical protein
MSQNIIRFFNDFAATFPSDKSAEKAAFEQNIAQVFADDLATAVQRSGAKNISPQVGNLVFWRTAAQEIQCGIVLNDKTSVLRLDGNSTEKLPLPKEVIGVADARGLLSKDATTEYNDMVRSIRNYEEKVGILNKITTETGLELEAEMYFTAHLSPAIAMIVRSFEQNLMAISPAAPNVLQQIKALVENKGRELWDKAVQLAQANNFENPDDRPLYWARLRMAVALKKHNFFAANVDYRLSDGLIISGSALQSIAIRFEEVTRNYTHVSFPSNLKKILITGFDPFFLNEEEPELKNHIPCIRQSNPSGATALALHGKVLKDNNGCDYAVIQVMIVPVRYTDFDGSQANYGNIQGTGIVEKYIQAYIVDDNKRADMIVTISQALEGNYNIDRFATLRRGGSYDNMLCKRAQISKILNSTDEYIETTLPKAMVPVFPVTTSDPNPNTQGHYVIYAQHYVLQSGDGDILSPSASDHSPYVMRNNGVDIDGVSPLYKPSNTQIMGGPDTVLGNTPILVNTFPSEVDPMIKGSGGNYLSNEIFYRVAKMRKNWIGTNTNRRFPSGHFHISQLQVSNGYYKSDYSPFQTNNLIKTVVDRLNRGVLGTNDLLGQ